MGAQWATLCSWWRWGRRPNCPPARSARPPAAAAAGTGCAPPLLPAATAPMPMHALLKQRSHLYRPAFPQSNTRTLLKAKESSVVASEVRSTAHVPYTSSWFFSRSVNTCRELSGRRQVNTQHHACHDARSDNQTGSRRATAALCKAALCVPQPVLGRWAQIGSLAGRVESFKQVGALLAGAAPKTARTLLAAHNHSHLRLTPCWLP